MAMRNIGDKVANLTLYDVKAAIRKAQNVMMNYTEMEGKVREATNNEPWGTSSTLMQEIAQGTYHYIHFNEIMPMIYKRFTEKTVEEWRQIYKALQLLEFLVKNGSERVVDDARAHISVMKRLRSFYYVDEQMIDQGINIRNRAKELCDLLTDSERLHIERSRARKSRNKYTGIGNDDVSSISGTQSRSGRFGGFGSDSFARSSNGSRFNDDDEDEEEYIPPTSVATARSQRVYGDGGGFGGESQSYNGTRNAARYDEYDEDDSNTRPQVPVRKESRPKTSQKQSKDLFSFENEDETNFASQSVATAAPVSSSSVSAAADDEFDDFQSALPASSTGATSASTQASVTRKAAEIMSFSGQQLNGKVAKGNSSSIPVTPAVNNTSQDAFSSIWSQALVTPSQSLRTPSSEAAVNSFSATRDKPSAASSASGDDISTLKSMPALVPKPASKINRQDQQSAPLSQPNGAVASGTDLLT